MMVILLCSNTVEEMELEDDCNETIIQSFVLFKNCNGSIVKDFSELQSYIMSNKSVIANLTEVFSFRPGRDP